MSALGFLGGLGQFANSFQQGYEKSEDRETALKERQFLEGQRQRKLDEQKRADELRNADSGIKTTEEIDDPNFVPAPVSPNQVAQVTINEDGTETVAAPPAPQAAPKITRQRQWDAIYRDYAANRQKAGDTAGALEFTDKANKIAAQRSANAFLQVQADAAGKSPVQLAQEIGKIFDSDPMNGGTKSIEPIEGGVRMTLFNKDTGQTSTKDFTGPDASKKLLDAFNPYFRPDSYAKLLEKRIETQDARTAELLKPYTLRPGEKRQVVGADGKVMTIGENPTDRVQIGEDAEGNPIYGKPAGTGRGAGTGSGKAPKESIDAATDLLKDFLGKADGSPESAQRQARAVSLLDGIYSGNPGVSPRTAAAIAADASADPSRVSLQIDNRTGLIGKVYKNPDLDGGRQYNLAPNGAQVAEMEKAVGKQGMVQAVNGMIESIAAGAPEENRAAVRDQFIAVASNPAARAEFLAAAKEAGRDTQALNRQLDLVKAYVPAPKANTKAPAVAQPGGLRPQAADPTSPAGRAQARQAQLRAEAAAKDQQRAEAQQALSKQFQSDKNTLDPLALAQKYDSLRGQLPTADAAELQRIERNIR